MVAKQVTLFDLALFLSGQTPQHLPQNPYAECIRETLERYPTLRATRIRDR